MSYALTIEIARAGKAGDPYAFHCVPQDYVFRHEQGFGHAGFPWGDEVLDELVQLLQPRPGAEVVQRIGERLRSFLEDGLRMLEGWARHEENILRAVRTGQPVSLTLRFGAAELYSLPWELVALRSTGQRLGELPGCLLRYEWPGARAVPTASRHVRPARLLFGWSAAGGAVPWDAHQQALARSGPEAGYGFHPARDVLPRLSRATLERALQEAAAAREPVSLLHLLCHGTRSASGTPGLLWDASEPGGEPELIDAASMRQLLARHVGSLRLVVLCACHGGDPGVPGNALGGVAQALHRMGIRAVVASRMPLSVAGSLQLTESFYGALKQPEEVQPALLAAREALIRAGGFDWAALQFFGLPVDADPSVVPGRRRWRKPVAVLLASATTLAPVLIRRMTAEPVPAAGSAASAPEVAPNASPVLEDQPLAGQIWDEEDQPVAGARVSLFLAGREVSTETNASGWFHLELRAEPQASLSFEVRKEGFEPYVNTATLGNTALGFTLQRKKRR